MFPCCPQLEYLSLGNFEGVTTLKIHAPKLRVLYIWGGLEFYLQTPHVVDASICQRYNPDYQSSSESHLIQALGCLSSVGKLVLFRLSMTYLAYGSLLEELSNKFGHLKDMSLNICFSDAREAAAALCLLQNAPILQNLNILLLGLQLCGMK